MTTPIVYKTEWGKNETLMDELWENLDVSPIVVALSHEYAEEHGLARSAPFPWDDEKGIYHIKVFHQLHCLVSDDFANLMYTSLTWRTESHP